MAWMGGVGIGIVRREGSQVEATLAEGRGRYEGHRDTTTLLRCLHYHQQVRGYAVCEVRLH